MGELRTGVRVRAEGMGVIAKSTTTFLVLFYDSQMGSTEDGLTLLAFAAGQLAYATTVFITYYKLYGAVSLRLQSTHSEFVVNL